MSDSNLSLSHSLADDHEPSGGAIAAIAIAIILFIILCIIVAVVITICCTIRHDKRAIAKRRRQGVQTVPVRHSTQGQNVVFVVPASRSQVPPGTVLVPVVPSQQVEYYKVSICVYIHMYW